MSRVFAAMGYFVRRGREIYTEAYLDQATDLDVLAIRYVAPFRRVVQIVECKSGANKPLDRVFWLAGVKAYTEADSATLVRDSVKWNIKDFAKEAGVEILDLPAISEIEQNLNLDRGDWPGWIDQEYLTLRAARWTELLRADASSADLFQFLSGESRFHQPFAAIIFLMFHARRLSKLVDQSGETGEFCRYLLADCVSHLIMFLMAVAEATYGLGNREVSGYIHKGLKYGSLDARLADRLMSLAKNVTDQVLFERLGQRVALDETLFKFPEPSSVEEVTQIVRALLAEPIASTGLLPLADYVFFESFVRNRGKRLPWINTVFRDMDRARVIALLKEILAILFRAEVVPARLLAHADLASDFSKAPTQEALAQISFFAPPGETESDGGDTPSS